MLLRHYLNTLEDNHISVQGGAHSLTVKELLHAHRDQLDRLVITHHVNGRPHKAQVRTADIGIFLFTIRY